MFFIPWRNEEKYLISGFVTFEAHYKALKTTIESKSNEYEHHAEELELARQMMKLRHMLNRKIERQKMKG